MLTDFETTLLGIMMMVIMLGMGMTIKAAKLVIDGTVTVSGDVTAGGVSLDNHTHTDSMGGGTSGPS